MELQISAGLAAFQFFKSSFGTFKHGRAAYTKTVSRAPEKEVGRYRINNGSIDFYWFVSRYEHIKVSFSDNMLHFSILDLKRTGNQNKAQATYNQIFHSIEKRRRKLHLE